jgi:periplasmic protein TonB
MILESNTRDAHLISAWTTGLALLCLGVGLHGAAQPLLPVSDSLVKLDVGDNIVMVESFQAPAAADEALPQPEMKEEDLEIPPLPEITAPLTPPEMVEITPVEEVQHVTEQKPVMKKAEPTKPAPRQAAESAGQSSSDGSSSPVLFKGGGGGRFPSPPYPASARSAKQMGTVRLLVTVEPSGIPSSVEVTSSSGFPSLDSAARDTIERRWRWPSGDLRKFIVPVRFVLQ